VEKTASYKPTPSASFRDVACTLLAAVLSYIGAAILSRYLQWESEPLVRVGSFFLLLLSIRVCMREASVQMPPLRELVAFGVFSCFLALSVVLGYHIVLEGGFDGTLDQNRIIPYTPLDIVAFFFISATVFVFSFAAFFALRSTGVKSKIRTPPSDTLSPLDARWVIGLAAIMFVAWIPYVLAYWPGLVFGDSLSSIRQALGAQEWSNHFPVAYTLILKGCIAITGAIGFDATAGCALYSIMQMLLMALAFGFLCRWVTVRACVNGLWGIIIAVLLGLLPHIATYSIAMWKDPLFSAAAVVASLLLMDLALSRGYVVRSRWWWMPMFAFSLLAMALLRNNGLYVVAFVSTALLVMAAASWRRDKEHNLVKATLCGFAVILVAFCITGPLYAAIGIKEAPRAESLGVPLNQMARVVATGGSMTEDDKAYMDSILPIELYPEAYRPSLTDNLKTDDSFNASALEDGFFEHWLSMLWQNPQLYFESWELQTCGFWTVNQIDTLASNENISGGLPRNLKPLGNEAGIHYENKLGSDELRVTLFPLDEWAVPAGIINWAIVYLGICLLLLKRSGWVIGLVPSLGIVMTLLVATPAYYWPRYEAACYFLVPFYIATALMLARSRQTTT
jgi:hypothetical protein